MRSLLRVERHDLGGGVTLYTQGAIASSRITVASWISPAGSSRDPPGKEGLAALTGRLLVTGTRKWDKRELARRLDRIAATLSVDVSWDGVTAEITGPTVVEQELLDILSEVVAHPRFDPAEVVRIRTAMEERLARDASQPSHRAERAFLETLFPEGHPYHRNPGGNRRSVRALRPRDVADFHHRNYRTGGSKIVITSRSEERAVLRAVKARMPPLPDGTTTRPSLPGRTPPGAPREIALPIAGSQQVEILVGGIAPSRTHPAFSALRMGNEVLGGRPILSRLFQSVREQEGLAYDTESDVTMLPEGGFWSAAAGTGAKTVRRVLGILQRETRRMMTQPVSPEELHAIRESFIGSFLLHTDTPLAAHSFADEVATYDLPPDHFETWPAELRRLTPEDIRTAMAEHLEGWARPLVVVAGPPEGVRSIRGG